jgi:hypothetical protein
MASESVRPRVRSITGPPLAITAGTPVSGPSGPAPVASTPISEEINPLVIRTLTNIPNTAMINTHFGRGSRR